MYDKICLLHTLDSSVFVASYTWYTCLHEAKIWKILIKLQPTQHQQQCRCAQFGNILENIPGGIEIADASAYRDMFPHRINAPVPHINWINAYQRQLIHRSTADVRKHIWNCVVLVNMPYMPQALRRSLSILTTLFYIDSSKVYVFGMLTHFDSFLASHI